MRCSDTVLCFGEFRRYHSDRNSNTQYLVRRLLFRFDCLTTVNIVAQDLENEKWKFSKFLFQRKTIFHSVYFTLNNCANSRSKVWDALFARVNLWYYQAFFWRLKKNSWRMVTHELTLPLFAYRHHHWEEIIVGTACLLFVFFFLMQIKVNVNKRNMKWKASIISYNFSV